MSKYLKTTARVMLGGIVAGAAFAGFGVSSANAALMFDVQALTINGNPVGDAHAVAANIGDVITYQICATVSDGDANLNNDGFQSGEGRIVSLTAVGVKGNLTHSVSAPFNAQSSYSGMPQDIDGDTDIDVGAMSNLDGSPNGIVYRAATLTTNGTGTFIVGGGTFTVTDLGDSSETTITFEAASAANLNNNPLWLEDGVTKTRSNGTVTSQSLIVSVPEPASFSLLSLAGLLAFKRRRRD
jgi:hypothetical protein